jgi:ribosomal protein RSM22 (predicted rRNA methylase)
MRALATRLTESLPQSFLRTMHDVKLPDLHGLRSVAPSGKDVRTIAMAAFTFGELEHPKTREQVLQNMWDSGAEVLVFVERGTPGGFALIASIRNDLLKRAKRSAKDQCHVLAPCPHDQACPLRFSSDFCHFAQRSRPPPLSYLHLIMLQSKGRLSL